MSTLARKLKAMGACREAVKWAKDHKWPDAWQKCERGDWMLWLCGAMQGKEGWPPRQQIVLVACDCVELVLPIFEKKYPDDKRVRECLETTRKWANGEATIEDVRKARAAACAACAAAYTADAADAAYAADAAAPPPTPPTPPAPPPLPAPPPTRARICKINTLNFVGSD